MHDHWSADFHAIPILNQMYGKWSRSGYFARQAVEYLVGTVRFELTTPAPHSRTPLALRHRAPGWRSIVGSQLVSDARRSASVARSAFLSVESRVISAGANC